VHIVKWPSYRCAKAAQTLQSTVRICFLRSQQPRRIRPRSVPPRLQYVHILLFFLLFGGLFGNPPITDADFAADGPDGEGAGADGWTCDWLRIPTEGGQHSDDCGQRVRAA
jgi:hypothetical protein